MPSTTPAPVTLSTTNRSTVGDFIALCNGTVLMANDVANSIQTLNVVTGAAGPTYSLSSAPGQLKFDPQYSYLYATLPSINAIAKVDLNTGIVTNISLSQQAHYVAVGPAGLVFACLNTFPVTVALINGPSASVLKTTPYAYPGSAKPTEGLLAYDFARNQLFLGVTNSSGAPLYRDSFDTSAMTLASQEMRNDVGGYARELEVSADSNHLVYPVGSGNDNGVSYVMYDFSPASLAVTFGSWPNGLNPLTVGFSPDSSNLASTDEMNLLIFDVSSHALKTSFNLSSLFSGITTVRYSKGGKLVYALYSTDGSNELITWEPSP